MKSFKTLFAILAAFLLSCGCSSVTYSVKNISPQSADKIRAELKTDIFLPKNTPIFSVYKDIISEHSNKNAVMLIADGTQALAARAALIRMARHSIDIQTYIYDSDTFSDILTLELKKAADRGVKVRVLIDDQGLKKDSSAITALNNHPNVRIKIFNPYKYRPRSGRNLQFISNMKRMNYRMHNKLFIADNAAVIIGGRNISDKYFNNNEKYNFFDMDALLIGRAAADALKSFNEYWIYHKSIPVELFPDTAAKKEIEENTDTFIKYDKTVNQFMANYKNKKLPIVSCTAEIIADSPLKTEGNTGISPIWRNTREFLLKSGSDIFINAAYIVPEADGMELFNQIKQDGRQINILTNSLSSTNLSVVYSGWDNYRDKLLENGIDIYEFRKDSFKASDKPKAKSALHTKVIVIDDMTVWIGSFNLDNRSKVYSTETIAIIKSREFSKSVKEKTLEFMDEKTVWKLSLKNGKPRWKTVKDGKEIITNKPPDTSSGFRSLMKFLKIVPERLL